MALTLAVSTRNAMLDAIETDIGAGAILKIRSGAAPSNVAAASTGNVLATMQLPSDWMAAASNGTKAKSGTWSDLTADANGTAGHYEITQADGTTVKLRGKVTVTGGDGEMTFDSISITAGQEVTVTSYVLTAPNAGV